jgi:hypothetical protein
VVGEERERGRGRTHGGGRRELWPGFEAGGKVAL